MDPGGLEGKERNPERVDLARDTQPGVWFQAAWQEVAKVTPPPGKKVQLTESQNWGAILPSHMVSKWLESSYEVNPRTLLPHGDP